MLYPLLGVPVPHYLTHSQKGQYAVTSMNKGRYLLCLGGTAQCEVGLLKLKLETCAPTLDEQLAMIGVEAEDGKVDA